MRNLINPFITYIIGIVIAGVTTLILFWGSDKLHISDRSMIFVCFMIMFINFYRYDRKIYNLKKELKSKYNTPLKFK